MKSWFVHHLHSLRQAAQQFRETPLATLFTILVIGVTVALPSGLYTLLDNLDRVGQAHKPQAEIVVFLKTSTDETQGKNFVGQIRHDNRIASVRFVSKEEGLHKLEAAGLSDLTAGLPENPLPHSLIVKPNDLSASTLENLGAELARHTEVEQVLLDTDWARRLEALMQLGRDLVFMLAILLGLALAAITANTIRLQIYAQKNEIEVARLIGATDRFIRRPFLYFGSIQGVLGGIVGWALVLSGLQLIEHSVSNVAAAYGATFALTGPGVGIFLFSLALSGILSWLGAFFAVGQTLRQVETF